MLVKELMKTDVVTCAPETDLAAVARAMRDHDCGFVPVVDSRGAVTGVLTDRDVCVAEASRRAPTRLAASEVASRPVIACFPDENVKDVLATMGKHHVRRMPVIEKEHGNLRGVLSLDDIILAPRRRGSPTSEEIVTALRAICARRILEPTTA